jgi:3-mercaptopyruvate sulfurtransferase SseA
MYHAVLITQWTKNSTLAAAAYFNLLVAAFSSVAVVATGLAAWQWARRKLSAAAVAD